MTQLRPARVNKFMLREFAAWLARGHPEWAGTQQTTMDVWRKLVQWAHVCMAVDVHSDPKNYPLFVAHARDAFTHAGWHLPSKKPPKGTLRFLRPAPLVSPEPFTAATALSYTPAGTCVTPPPPTPPPFASVAAAGGSSTTPCPTPAWQPKYAWQAHNNRDLPADIAPMPLAADESPFLARSRAWVSAYEEADSMLLCSGDDVGGACHFGVLLEPCFAMHETVREDNRAPLAAQLPPPPPPTQPPTDVPPQLPVQQSLSSASSPCNTTTPTADTTTTTTLCDAVPNDGACTPRRCVSSAFVQTLANIVDNAPQDVIAWEPSGDTVVIHDCERCVHFCSGLAV